MDSSYHTSLKSNMLLILWFHKCWRKKRSLMIRMDFCHSIPDIADVHCIHNTSLEILTTFLFNTLLYIQLPCTWVILLHHCMESKSGFFSAVVTLQIPFLASSVSSFVLVFCSSQAREYLIPGSLNYSFHWSIY